MAYPNMNQGFYPQAFPQMNPYINNHQNTNGINWVQGIEGAKAWQLQPNSNIVLLDSDNNGTFYIKSSDAVGMYNLRIFKYEEITGVQKPSTDIDLSEYVKRSELETLIKSIIGGQNNEQSVSTANGNTRKKSLITE